MRQTIGTRFRMPPATIVHLCPHLTAPTTLNSLILSTRHTHIYVHILTFPSRQCHWWSLHRPYFFAFSIFFFRKTNEVFLTAFYHLHFTKSSDSKSIKHHSDRGYQKMGYEGRRIMECARSMAIPECQEEFVESESKFRKWIRKICCIACKMPDWKTALPRKMKSPSRIDWESDGRRHSCATRRAIAADDHLYVFL